MPLVRSLLVFALYIGGMNIMIGIITKSETTCKMLLFVSLLAFEFMA